MMTARCSCPENLLLPTEKIKLSTSEARLFGQAYVRLLLVRGHDLSSELESGGLLVEVCLGRDSQSSFRIRGVKVWDLKVGNLVN